MFTTTYCSFNHKTGEEDVHFTAELPHSESDSEADETDNSDAASAATDEEDETSSKNSTSPEQSLEDENTDEEAKEEEDSSMLQDDVSSLEMIMVKNVPAGAEVCMVLFIFQTLDLIHIDAIIIFLC